MGYPITLYPYAIQRSEKPAGTIDLAAAPTDLVTLRPGHSQYEVERTMMERLGAAVFSEGDDSFLLLSASSSAGSFLNATEFFAR